MLKRSLLLLCFVLALMACDGSTGPVEDVYSWEDNSWASVGTSLGPGFVTSYSIKNDSLYVMFVHKPDSSGYITSTFPDIVSFDILYPAGLADPWSRDGIRVLTSSDQLLTDDWYAYDDPFGLTNSSTIDSSIYYQPDTLLGGSIDVNGVFLGELNGDSTVVFRRAFSTQDAEYDCQLKSGTSYGACLYLQWGEMMQPDYVQLESDEFQITI